MPTGDMFEMKLSELKIKLKFKYYFLAKERSHINRKLLKEDISELISKIKEMETIKRMEG